MTISVLIKNDSNQISQILNNNMHKGDGFSAKTLGKAYFIYKLTGQAMVWPASSDKR